jgi:OOP family OmpA-OmpF porin
MSQARWKLAVAATTVVVGSAAVAGCGAGSPSGTTSSVTSCLASGVPVALAIGARSNSPTPSISPVTAVLNSAISAKKPVTLVRIDGKPTVVFSKAVQPGPNSQISKQIRNNYVSKLQSILDGTNNPATDIRAQAPQADVLDALATAASTVPPGGDVIVMDSGLQTTPPLDFRAGLLTDDTASIIDFLKHSNELPDLKGRRVYFIGLGWTAAPQPSLSIADRRKVVQIWEQIAAAAGARCVGVNEEANTTSAISGLPPVAVVTPPPPPQPPKACSVISLGDNNHVGFNFNSTTFRDPAGAHATLQQLASLIIRTGESVKLTGSTSSEGSDQYNLALSLRRAKAVRNALVQLGVPASRITTFGDGSHLPGRLNDRGPNGQLLIGPAIKDRKVVAQLTGPKCRA